MSTIGQRIRCARESFGISQEQLGRLCGTTKQTIFKYENDIITNIPMDRLEAISHALHISPIYLMGWEDDPVSASDPEHTTNATHKFNVVRIASRDGTYQERHLSDQQLSALQAILDQMPDVPDGL